MCAANYEKLLSSLRVRGRYIDQDAGSRNVYTLGAFNKMRQTLFVVDYAQILLEDKGRHKKRYCIVPLETISCGHTVRDVQNHQKALSTPYMRLRGNRKQHNNWERTSRQMGGILPVAPSSSNVTTEMK